MTKTDHIMEKTWGTIISRSAMNTAYEITEIGFMKMLEKKFHSLRRIEDLKSENSD